MSTLKGYPSQQKLTNPVDGDTSRLSVSEAQYTTVQPLSPYQYGADNVPKFVFRLVAGDAVEAGSTKRVIVATAHGAREGDVIRFTSGNNLYAEAAIIGVPDANTMYLGVELINTPAVAETFDILRYASPRVASDGGIQTTSGPIQFVLDGADTEVEEDTADYNNNIPLPVKQITPPNAVLDTIFFDYAVDGPVDNTAWVEILANTSGDVMRLTWFDSGGYAMEIGIGAAASESRLFVAPPGGFNGAITIDVPAGERLSIKCLETQTVSVGLIVANLLK